MHRFAPPVVAAAVAVLLCLVSAVPSAAAPIHHITIDGQFGDWAAVPSYFDPANDQHDTDHDGPLDVPAYVNHPDVDILQYKFTHDAENLYAYFRARGNIGATQAQSPGKRAGRYYVILTIDVDDDDVTGYPIHEGGYYPTSDGYDMNMEIEYFNGTFNTGHYLNHGALTAADLPGMEAQQKQGIVDVRPGVYDHYTQWVMFDDPSSGDHNLNDGTSITFVKDQGPVHQGIIRASISPDGHEIEMVAPFQGFMSYPGANAGERGDWIMALGKTIDISFSLEASGELHAASGNGTWASDTAEPIVGYYLGVPEPATVALAAIMGATFLRRSKREA
ncbi:MAG: PEP-CTERM sorting domain-containing protein [Planctomycetaceae bacterium]|nr:PEP-CTERM sorting domain-containing protein [Planctomycetaceae bacterium]